ncbi:MAG: hypothetical protein KC468_29120 [Myxococcales bacterium]|nr:hypothetical protein [Myxococcales bacterium]
MGGSPKIIKCIWGQVNIEGVGRVRDAMLYPGGGEAWDWRASDTHHVPGIQICDVERLLEAGARTVVLSRGVNLVLQTPDETRRFLERQKVVYHVLQTHEAVALYNELQGREAVGALIHSTC